MKGINKIIILITIIIFFITACSGKKYFNKLIENGNIKKYYDENGNVITNCWKEINGDWYYFNNSGHAEINQWIDNLYYVDEESKMLKNTTKRINGKMYCFDNNGKYVVGWYNNNGKYLYLNNQGEAVAGWKEIDGKNYYFSHIDYTMLSNCWTDDGYFVNSNGEALPGIGNGYASSATLELTNTTDNIIKNVQQGTKFYFNFFRKYSSNVITGHYTIKENNNIIDEENFIWNANSGLNLWITPNKAGSITINMYDKSNNLLIENSINVIGTKSNNNSQKNTFSSENVTFEGGSADYLSSCLSELEYYVHGYIDGNIEYRPLIEICFDQFIKATLRVQENIQIINYWNEAAEYRDLSKAKEIIKFYRSMFTFLR